VAKTAQRADRHRKDSSWTTTPNSRTWPGSNPQLPPVGSARSLPSPTVWVGMMMRTGPTEMA
jgi:hypothetical protein